MPVRDSRQDLRDRKTCGLHGAALLATRTEPAGLATERQKVFQFAVGAPNAGEFAVQIAAVEEFLQSLADHGPQRAEPTYQLPPVRLRAEEVFSFFVARKLLENFIGTPMKLAMRSVMEKIAESMQGFVTVDLEAMTDRFSVIGDDHAVIDTAV
jgi:hypothetical protein